MNRKQIGLIVATFVGLTGAALRGQQEQLPAPAAPATGPATQPATRRSDAPPADRRAADVLPADVGELKLSGNEIKVETTESGQLILMGSEEDIAQLEAFIAKLDSERVGLKLDIITLKKRPANEVAQALQRALDKMLTPPGGRQRSEDRVLITAVSNNVLLIAAAESRMEQIRRIVDAIEAVEPRIPDFEDATFNLKHVKPSDAKGPLKEVIDAIRKQQGEIATGQQIQYLPNDAAATLTVIGISKTEREKLEHLLSIIDAAPSSDFGGNSKVVIYPLLNAEPEALVKVLTDMIAGAKTGQGQAAAAGALEAIRRLTVSKRNPDGSFTDTGESLDLSRPFKINGDKDSKSLIVQMTEANVGPMTELIKLLDTVPVGAEMAVQIFALQHGDAETFAKMIKEMFEAGKKLPQPAPGDEKSKAVPEGPVGESLVYNIALSADARTNTLVAAGRPVQIALVQAIVKQLDVESSSAKFPLKLLFLGKNVDATRVGAVITELFDRRTKALEQQKAGIAAVERERVFLAVDVRSNALIVSANETNFQEISEIAAKLDVPGERLIDNIRIINCTNTSAADLESKITELWKRKAELKTSADSKAPKDLPIIVADQRSNALVIASSPEDFNEIERLVARLEAQPLAPMAQIRLLTLTQNDAKEIGTNLKTLFEDRAKQRLAKGQEESPSDKVAIVADQATNTLLIASSNENFDEMERIVTAIDTMPPEGVVQVFQVTTATASNIAETIKKLFDAGIYTPSAGTTGELAKERKKIAIIADPRSNTIIASGSRPNLALVEKLIESMDKAEAKVPGDMEILELKFADAVKIADMLKNLFEGVSKSTPDGSKSFPAPTIIADQRSNSLIISGSPDSLAKARELAARLDKEGPPTTNFEIYRLDNASAIKLAPRLQDMFKKREEGGEKSKATPINITADESSNSLIASASPEDHATIRSLLTLLDRPSSISRQVEIFPLMHAKAEAIADKLDKLFKSQGGQGAGAQARADAIAVQPDPHANALIVWAAPADMENIRQIIDKLDSTRPTNEMTVRVIQLKQALAKDLATSLDKMLNGDAKGKDQPALIVNFKETLPDGTQVERQLLRQDITITPYEKSNSLMVMAPRDSMEMLENLIQYVDRQPPTLAEIRLFPLANADAEEVVDRLKDLFEKKTTGTQGETERRLIFEGGGAAGGAAAPAAPTGGLSAEGEGGGARQELRFTADRRTNTVVAAGSPVDLNMVENFVRQLDGPDQSERIQNVFKPVNMKATDIGKAISDFNQKERDRFKDLEKETAKARVAERELTAVADEASNTILIGASPRYYDQYMDMIRKIDRPPPQVMIQVLIAEITLNDRIELGLEFAAQDLHFTEKAVVGPNGVIKGPGFDFAGGTSLGAAGAGGGFSFTVTGEDFSFLLRALQTDGRAEVLSRPTVMVQNNEKGNITIGDRVPFVRNAQVTQNGQLQSQVEYEDVGIKLDVTPHINPDGYTNLEIHPEISALGASTVPITEGLNAPTFTKRSADTTVTIKDGETIVIGGLITSSTIHRETKVPIIGDIPGLGLLFRTNTDDRERRELLVVLTSRVIWDEDQARAVSLEQRDKTDIIPENVKRNPLFEGLRIRAEDESPLPMSPRPVVPNERPNEKIITPPPNYGPTPGIYGPNAPRRTNNDKATPGAELTAADYGPRIARPVASP